ncbi:hypothetical protein GGR54DRAFT_582840 [Hypoxylon sp. NC1633]|nr:hypothetical protein GGR54DRAFT_582840 [Hypoxylon sp. NC1633]
MSSESELDDPKLGLVKEGGGVEQWTSLIDSIDAALKNNFSEYETANFLSLPPFVVALNARLNYVLERVAKAQVKDTVGDAKALFERVLVMLGRFHDYVRNNIETLTQYRDFAHKIRVRTMTLSRQPFITFDTRMRDHIRDMFRIARENETRLEDVWQGTDLINHSRFRTAFDEFMELTEKIKLEDDYAHWRLMFHSQDILHDAFAGLHIPSAAFSIRADLFNDRRRPTYIDYSCQSREYLYGHGDRPGVLYLKETLGGPITEEEREGMDAAKRQGKKRPAPADEPQPAPVVGYTMTLDNAEADIDDVYSDAKYKGRHARPVDRLVTPTATNREDTLRNYKAEIIKRLKRFEQAYFKSDTPPATQAEREQMMTALSIGIGELRINIRAVNPKRNNTNGIWKEARINTIGLKYLRSLHMKLLLSSEPPPTQDKLVRNLIDRIDDWILFEEIWTGADQNTIRLQRTSETTKAHLRRFVTQRTTNINKWRTFRTELENILAGNAPLPGGDGNEPAPNPPEVEEAEQAPDPDDLPWAVRRGMPPRRRDPNEIPFHYLRPHRPSRTVYFNERQEKRERERMLERAKRRALGPRLPGEVDELEEEYAREDAIIAKVAATFAKGGPPHFEQIPTEGVFDKLVYMIVLSQWRHYNGRPLLDIM